MIETSPLWGLHIVVMAAVVVRILLRPHREPASRIAWVAVVGALPVIGIIAYLLLGETNIGRRHIKAMHQAIELLPHTPEAALDKLEALDVAEHQAGRVPEQYAHLFSVGHSISGFSPVAGNCATLMADSNGTIDGMVSDIDAAVDQVNVLFYISG